MPLIFILEDSSIDLRKAVDIATQAGFNQFEVHRLATDAGVYLQEALNDSVPMPDAMLLDLDLGHESGFEVIRKRYINKRLRAVPVIVWSALGNQEREFCRLFAVEKFVHKDDGDQALREALANLLGTP